MLKKPIQNQSCNGTEIGLPPTVFHLILAEDADELPTEAALRCTGSAFHEQHNLPTVRVADDPIESSLTGAALTNFSRRALSSALSGWLDEYSGAVCGSGSLGAYELRSLVAVGAPLVWGVASSRGGRLLFPALPVPACFSTAARTLAASLPLTVSRVLPPRWSTRKGTAVTS